MATRKEVEGFILENIDAILPGSPNKGYYIKLFAGMNDKEFEQFLIDLQSGKKILSIITPNLAKGAKLDIKRNIKIAETLGHSFFQKIVFGPNDGKPGYMTPIPYLVIKLPLRRQAQHLIKKISIPEDNNSVDDFSGQPTGKSRGSRISLPETQVLAALNMKATLAELLKYRGGDRGAFNAMNASISNTGGVRLSSIENQATGVESTKALKVFLTAMHLKNSLV